MVDRAWFLIGVLGVVVVYGQEPLFVPRDCSQDFIEYFSLSDCCNQQQKIQDWFWYTKFVKLPTCDAAECSKRVIVGVIDFFEGDFSEKNNNYDDFYFRLNSSVEIMKNLTPEQSKGNHRSNNQKNKKASSQLMKNKKFVVDLLKKNHGMIASVFIKLLAGAVEIIPISIPMHATLYDLQQACMKAVKLHAHVVYIGWQWDTTGANLEFKKSIEKMAREHFIVIAPAGNDAYIVQGVGYPANSLSVVSVGAFGKHLNNLCAFSQMTKNSPVDFVMPGQNIATVIWVPELQEYNIIKITGTSFAAALMTGYVAQLLTQSTKAKVLKTLKKTSRHLDSSWLSVVRYGTPL
ncbi:S8/S53 family peptidase [Candidatus Babeliales bacterium]|nr:S8/S53 family peptidase [Candidatus Babeliales bacterium]